MEADLDDDLPGRAQVHEELAPVDVRTEHRAVRVEPRDGIPQHGEADVVGQGKPRGVVRDRLQKLL